jgi:hypothetical protein
MKPVSILYLLFVLPAGMLVPVSINAQCSGTLKSVSYDTLVMGTGNDTYSFNASQFNPSLGTLVAVSLKTRVSVGYSFEAENVTSGTRAVTIGIGRYDYLVNPVLANGYYANGTQKNYGPYTLGASDGVAGSGVDYIEKAPFAFLNGDIVINDSITTAVAGFLGYGVVSFDYYPSTYSIIPSNLAYVFTANDTTRFSITYYYCDPTILPSHITSFTAAREDNSSVKLLWKTVNEETGKIYEVEESADGNNFQYIASVASVPGEDAIGNYIYHYSIKAGDKGKIYFRLKQIDQHGWITYSEIKSVDLGEEVSRAGLTIFPSPAHNFINVDFNQPSAKDWQVDIFAAHGGLIQRDFYLNTTTAHIIFKGKLAAGVYFIRALDKDTQKSYLSTFLVM